MLVKMTNLIEDGNKALKFGYFWTEIGHNLWRSAINLKNSIVECWTVIAKLRQKEIPIFLKNEIRCEFTDKEPKQQDPEFLADHAFLPENTQHLNELNLKLQKNIANLFEYMNGFNKKLRLFKN